MNNLAHKKILLVGGGTGGHAAPILAIYKKLKNDNPDLIISVAGNGSAEEKIFFDKISEYEIIQSGKINRYVTWKNIREGYHFLVGFFQSLMLLHKFRPDLIFSKGGYTSMPILLAAGIMKIPYFLHESDISMGQVNRIMSRKAEKVFVCFPVNYFKMIEQTKLIQSGPILREGFSDKNYHPDRTQFGFTDDKPVILITGGSQGSKTLTEAVINTGDMLLNDFNIIHQAGKHSIGIAQEFQSSLDPTLKTRYCLREFLIADGEKDEMLTAIRAADLIITRAGSTIAEVAVLGKPMILVPWKHAAQNHQEKNAEFFLKNGAGIVIRDDELNGEKLSAAIYDLFNDSNKLKDLSAAASKLMPDDGVGLICDTIISKLVS